MATAQQVNADFQAELAALLGTKNVGTEHYQDSGRIEDGKVEHLKAPGTIIEDGKALGNSITTKELFGDEFIEGEIPELSQDFTILASRKDRLMELGQVAQEVYTTKKLCRSQMVAMESIARELIPATPEETAGDTRKVLVADHELNMYTEAPSSVEVQSTIDNSQVVLDRALGEIKNSAKVLAEKVIQVANSDMQRRNENLVQGISTFNAAIIKFLDATESKDLVNTRVRFRTNLNWGNLMAMGIDRAHGDAMGFSDRENGRAEKSIAAFDGTSAETLFKSFGDFVAENAIAMPVIANFISGNFNVIRNDGDRRTSIKERHGENVYIDGQTFGELFDTFGSTRFVEFFNGLNDYISNEVNATKIALEMISKANTLEDVTMISMATQRAHSNIMAASANMAVICAVQQMVKDFLEKFN
jgi:hypothetical protein